MRLIQRSEAAINEAIRSTLSYMRPDFIVEVGSFDGETLRHYVESSPSSRGIGFEGNPNNFFKYCAGKPIHNLIVSNTVGLKTFYEPIERGRGKTVDWSRSRVSSIMEVSDALLSKQYNVLSTTLDTFFETQINERKTFALIIDAEGSAYNVLDGADKFLDRTILIKAEVEDVACWEGQHLAQDVRNLLVDRFTEVANNKLDPKQKQHNVVYINKQCEKARGYFNAIQGEY